MICRICGQRLLGAYTTDRTKKTRMKKIGLFCFNCSRLIEQSQFLIDERLKVQNKIINESKKTKSKPKFSEFSVICQNPKCKSERIRIVRHSEQIRVEFDKGRQEWTVNLNNPYNECTCKKCGNHWPSGLPLPSNPHYLVPKKIGKSKLRLILQRVPRNRLSIPKNLISLEKEISQELEKKP